MPPRSRSTLVAGPRSASTSGSAPTAATRPSLTATASAQRRAGSAVYTRATTTIAVRTGQPNITPGGVRGVPRRRASADQAAPAGAGSSGTRHSSSSTSLWTTLPRLEVIATSGRAAAQASGSTTRVHSPTAASTSAARPRTRPGRRGRTPPGRRRRSGAPSGAARPRRVVVVVPAACQHATAPAPLPARRWAGRDAAPGGPARLPGGHRGGELKQVGQAEGRARGRQRGAPGGVDRPVGLAVGVDDPDQDLADDAAADRPEPLAAAAVLGLLEDVEPQRRLQPPAAGGEAGLLGGQRLDPEVAGDRLAG